MSQLTCIVVTPEETAVETQADFIALPLFDGEIGLAPIMRPDRAAWFRRNACENR